MELQEQEAKKMEKLRVNNMRGCVSMVGWHWIGIVDFGRCDANVYDERYHAVTGEANLTVGDDGRLNGKDGAACLTDIDMPVEASKMKLVRNLGLDDRCYFSALFDLIFMV